MRLLYNYHNYDSERDLDLPGNHGVTPHRQIHRIVRRSPRAKCGRRKTGYSAELGSARVMSIVPASSGEISSASLSGADGSGQTTFQARWSFSNVQMT